MGQGTLRSINLGAEEMAACKVTTCLLLHQDAGAGVRIPPGKATACPVAQLLEPRETGNEGSSPSGNRAAII